MKTHELKCWTEYYGPIEDGAKPFDLRRNDRHFVAGDKVRLREWDDRNDAYTGREVTKTISYVLEGVGPGAIRPLHGLTRDYCILGFAPATCPSSPSSAT